MSQRGGNPERRNDVRIDDLNRGGYLILRNRCRR